MKRTAILPAVIFAGSLALLGACSSSDEESPTAASTTSQADSPAPTEAAPEPSDEPTQEPAQAAREVPSECSDLSLTAGQQYSGQELGACVSAALVSFGSGRMDSTGDQLQGTAEFLYSPEYSVKVAGKADGSSMSLVFVEDTMWVDNGSGWVEGDINSSDQEEMLAGLAGELYRIYSDPIQTANLVSGGDSWTTASALETKKLPNGQSVESFKITNDAPFTWNDIQVEELVLWYGPDWLPVATQATTSVAGLGSITNGQEFYDLGTEITIEPPV